MRVVDCQGLAGSPAYGAVMEGFELAAVKSVAGFGVRNLLANRHLLPGDWQVELSELGDWTPEEGVDFLYGCPPCAGFSLLNTSSGHKARGPDSSINDCMKMFAAYAGGGITGSDGKPGPLVAAFESVQAAGTQGIDLMRQLRRDVEAATGQRYKLSHVFMSGASVGAAQIRKRYFWVVSRIPFGLESPVVERVPTYGDAIWDLSDCTIQWEDQPVLLGPTWWSGSKRREDGLVDAHDYPVNPAVEFCIALARTGVWEPGTYMNEAINQYRHRYGGVPEGVDADKWEAWGTRGFNGPWRVHPKRAGHVVTGAGGYSFLHWDQDRILTVREVSRLMGFPDDWFWDGARTMNEAFAWLGKQVPVESTRWLAGWVARAVGGEPGRFGGWGSNELDDEYFFDFTNDYQRVFDWRTGESRDVRSRDTVTEMEARPA